MCMNVVECNVHDCGSDEDAIGVGIAMVGSDFCYVAGNIATNNGGEGTYVYTADSTTNAYYNRIIGNYVSNNTRTGIHCMHARVSFCRL